MIATYSLAAGAQDAPGYGANSETTQELQGRIARENEEQMARSRAQAQHPPVSPATLEAQAPFLAATASWLARVQKFNDDAKNAASAQLPPQRPIAWLGPECPAGTMARSKLDPLPGREGNNLTRTRTCVDPDNAVLSYEDACHMVGGAWCYEFAKGVEATWKNYDAVVSGYRSACRRGRIGEACERLGVLFETGFGVRQDYGEAGWWYGYGCHFKVGSACTKLGRLYNTGHAEDKDDQDPAWYFWLGCDQGDPQACVDLGDIYRNVVKEPVTAARFYKSACDEHLQVGCDRLKSTPLPPPPPPIAPPKDANAALSSAATSRNGLVTAHFPETFAANSANDEATLTITRKAHNANDIEKIVVSARESAQDFAAATSAWIKELEPDSTYQELYRGGAYCIPGHDGIHLGLGIRVSAEKMIFEEGCLFADAGHLYQTFYMLPVERRATEDHWFDGSSRPQFSNSARSAYAANSPPTVHGRQQGSERGAGSRSSIEVQLRVLGSSFNDAVTQTQTAVFPAGTHQIVPEVIEAIRRLTAELLVLDDEKTGSTDHRGHSFQNSARRCLCCELAADRPRSSTGQRTRRGLQVVDRGTAKRSLARLF